MRTTQFVISPAALAGLAGLIPGDKSPLSPLNLSDPPELTLEQHQELFEAGVFDINGLVDEARLMLAALAEAPAFVRLRVNAPAGFVDEALHFTGDGDATIGISNTPNGLVLSEPGDPAAIFAQVKELIGASALSASDWSVELLPLEMICLMALMDLRRKAVLHAIVDQQPVNPLPCDGPSVAEAIQSMWGNPQWLTTAIQSISSLRNPPAAALVQPALLALVEKKQAWLQNGSFYPCPEAIQTADRFLLIGSIVHLDSGSANLQGRHVFMRQTWLQAGATEILNLRPVEANLRLEVTSAKTALENMYHFLTRSDALPPPPIEAVNLSLAIVDGVGTGSIFPLAAETIIGRSEQADIHILDSRASRRHAVIRRLSQGYQLTDAGSTNGTLINNQLLVGPFWLHVGDHIKIGGTRLKVIGDGDPFPIPTGELAPVAPNNDASEDNSAPEPAKSHPEPLPLVVQASHDDAPLSPVNEADAPEDGAQHTGQPPERHTISVPQNTTPVLLCEHCHQPLQPGDSDCQACGQVVGQGLAPVPAAAVEMVCPHCGGLVNPAALYCGDCGQRITP